MKETPTEQMDNKVSSTMTILVFIIAITLVALGIATVAYSQGRNDAYELAVSRACRNQGYDGGYIHPASSEVYCLTKAPSEIRTLYIQND